MKSVNVAVVGCGAISDVYIKNMQELFSILNVTSCCDLNPEAAKKTSDKYGLKILTTEEIIADSEIEMVVNLTAPGAHYTVNKQLLEGGKNVYSEKPLSLEAEQAAELVRIADEKHCYLGASPDTFLGSAIQTAREIVDAGLIGEVTSCLATINRDYSFMYEFVPYTTKKGGGIGMDVGIYYMTALVYVLGAVSQVSGFTTTRKPKRIHEMPGKPGFGETFSVASESAMVGSLVFENGALGSVMFNSDCILPEQHNLVLYGTKGILYMANPDQFGGEVKLLRKWEETPVVIPSNHGYAENSRGIGAAEMAWAIRNHRSNRASKEMARNAAEALQGIMNSSENGCVYHCQSTFERPAPLPGGYRGNVGDAECALV
ncbi:MAG: Gfo/Idh/MocA family oxidoreductase [Lachnospiraceae bacterium]|nr:Gfo/Idh/MocA family oxidoreductase [Lachnospiraceae bacterium]